MLPSSDFFKDSCVGITGVTGTLGSALTKELLKPEYGVRRIVGISRKWQDQDRLAEDNGHDDRLRLFLGDIRDLDRMRLALVGVDYLFHTGALKAVPQAAYNPTECTSINITGTENVFTASRENSIARVVAISSDKACAPLTLYGATKQVVEHLAISFNSYSGGEGTRYCAIRYGNVVNSSGSVIPLFLRQRGDGKLTVTHDKMTRFWITIGEAVSFVIAAMVEMVGGEIFVPHLPSSSVMSLATTISPNAEIEIVGLRANEKIHEVLVVPEEARRTMDVGWAYRIAPEYHFWDRDLVYAGGSPVPAGWLYTSASAPRLTQDEIKVLL